MEATMLTLGVILIVVGLIGQVKAQEIEVGTKNPLVRLILGFIGIVFVLIALSKSITVPGLTPTESPTPVTQSAMIAPPTDTTLPPTPTQVPPTVTPLPPTPTQIVVFIPPPQTNNLTAKDALTMYYSLVENGEYDQTYQMLSREFIDRTSLTRSSYEIEWSKSGPASIVEYVDNNELGDNATVTVTLHYYRPDKQVYHTFSHQLTRHKGCIDTTFGCWQILAVQEIRR